MYRKNLLHKFELEKLTDGQRKFLDRFSSMFKGHPEAVQLALEIYNNLTNPLRMSQLPVVVMLAGVSRSGKSHFAKALAYAFHGRKDKSAIIDIQMGQLKTDRGIFELRGAPPAHHGYIEPAKVAELNPGDLDPSGKLSPHNLRRVVLDSPLSNEERVVKPSIIRIDEIEKGNEDIQDMFLEVFGEGKLSMSNGLESSFENSVFILTANSGVRDLMVRKVGVLETGKRSDDQYESAIFNKIAASFKPEFINRISYILIFKPLEDSIIRQIVDIPIAAFQQFLGNLPVGRRFTVEVDESARDFLFQSVMNESGDLSGLSTAFSFYVETPVGMLVRDGQVKAGDHVMITAGFDGSDLAMQVIPGNKLATVSVMESVHFAA
ncbi:MAG: AAA family ATPase [Candidatus Obscuribacterales bacterium]|jgi:ATP-dependent Clp protease ATP-binding subunit ClpA